MSAFESCVVRDEKFLESDGKRLEDPVDVGTSEIYEVDDEFDE